MGYRDMPFPEKFRALIEVREDQVTIPALAILRCLRGRRGACGWGGWIIESAWKTMGESSKEAVKADTEQRCPVCGKQVFRTEVEKQFRFNPDAGPKMDYPFEHYR